MQRLFNYKKKTERNLERPLWGYLRAMDTQMGHPIGVVKKSPLLVLLGLFPLKNAN